MEQIRLTLAAARVNADLTQKEAAKKLGISVTSLRSYEVGTRSPNWKTVQKMVDIYGVPVECFNLP